MPIFNKDTQTYCLTEFDYENLHKTVFRFESILENIIDKAENVRLVEEGFANLFHSIYQNYFFYVKEPSCGWYVFKQHRWHYHKRDILKDILMDTLRTFIKSFCRHYTSEYIKRKQELQKDVKEGKTFQISISEQLDNRLEKLQLNNNRSGSAGFIFTISRQLEELFHNPMRGMLMNSQSVLCFDNGVLDLKDCTFRDGKQEDYCTHSCLFPFVTMISHLSEENEQKGKDYDKLNRMNSFLDEIFIDNEKKEIFLTQMVYAIFGTNLSNQVNESSKVHLPVIFTSEKNDNKVLQILVNFIKFCFGDYVGQISSDITKEQIHFQTYGIYSSIYDMFKNNKILFLSENGQDLESLFAIAGEFLNDGVKFFITGRKSYFDSYPEQEKLSRFPQINVASEPQSSSDLSKLCNEEVNMQNLMNDLRSSFITLILKQRLKILG